MARPGSARGGTGGAAVKRVPLDLDFGVFQLPRWGAVVGVPMLLFFHVLIPVVWPHLPARPALVDRVPEFREWSITRSGWLEECLAEAPSYGCRSSAVGARATANAEMTLVRRAAELALAPVWAYWEAAARARRAMDVACPPDLPRRERAECRRFEMF